MLRTLLGSKKLALALASVVVVGGAAVAYQAGLFGSGESDQTGTVAYVPADVDVVVTFEQSLVTDGTTRALGEALTELSEEARDADSGSGLGKFENETGLDPKKVRQVTVFGRYGDALGDGDAGLSTDGEVATGADRRSLASDGDRSERAYAGAVVATEWSTADVETALRRSDVDYNRTTIAGKTVYEPTSNATSENAPEEATAADDTVAWIGVVDDGTYVVGSEQAVRDAIEVAAGERSAFGGELRDVYDATRDGHVTFAMRVPTDRLPDRESGSIDAGSYNEIRLVSGVYYTTGDVVGMQMRLRTNDTTAAKDLENIGNATVSLVTIRTDNETAKETLRNVTFDREGATVVVTFEESVAHLEKLFAYLQSYAESRYGPSIAARSAVAPAFGTALPERDAASAYRPDDI